MAINRLRQQQIFDSFEPVSFSYGQDDWQGPIQPTSFMPPGPQIPQYDPGMDPDINPQAPQMPTLSNPTRILQNPNEPRQNWMQMIDQLYQPETQASNRFNTLLDNAPELGRPGIARRLAATGMAFGSKTPIETAEKVMYAPYFREMEDWKAKSGPYYNAANLERQSNINERQLTGQMVTAQQNQQRLDETERKNRETAEIGMIRARAYAFKQEHPDWKFNFTGPTVMVTDPLTGTVHNTGIPTGSLTDFDKINLTAERRIEQIRETGNQQRQTQELRNTGAAEVARIRESNEGSGAASNPSQARIARNNRFQDIYDRFPQYRQFLERPTSPNGDWQLKDARTPGLFRTITADEQRAYAEVSRMLSGNQSQGTGRMGGPGPGAGGNATPQSRETPPQPASIPKDAQQVQYHRGLNKWRYWNGTKWIEVQ